MQFLQNILAAPLEILLGPKHFIEDMWLESGRSRALLLGFPAFLVGLVGILLIMLSQFASSDMEDGYVAVLERVAEEKGRLEIELLDEGRVADVASDGNSESEEEVDPRRQTLALLREEESVYLKKLISMNGKEPEYRFRLAMSKLRTDPGHGISILKSLAPEDEAGYADAHKYLARYYASLRASTRQESAINSELALAHADFSLKRDKTDNVSKAIKAQLLMKQERLSEANELFTELFAEDPRFYRPLLQINERMQRTDLNQSILERALLSYNERINRDDLDNRTWVSSWQQMVICYRELGDYERAVELLEVEIGGLTSAANSETAGQLSEGFGPRRVFLKKLLSNVYQSWAGSLVVSSETSKASKIECLRLITEAYRLSPSDPNVLRIIARLATDRDEEISNAAKEVYDPFTHFAAPSTVLNELGTASMQTNKFDAAVKFFELARKKDPNSPMILNNLAYSWLRSNEQDANRALQLVDQGLRLISGNPQWVQFRPNFLDTRGTALVKLGRFEEAIAAFEKALASQPNDISLLKQLVECYENAGLDTAVLSNRITRLEERDADAN